MKIKILTGIILPVLAYTSLFAQYNPNSYLRNPDQLIPFVNDCALFWSEVEDENNGGFFC